MFWKTIAILCLVSGSLAAGIREERNQDVEFSSNSLLREGDDDDSETVCMQKVMMVNRTEFQEEERCTHLTNQECHITYVTAHRNEYVEKCQEEFIKTCSIELVERPLTSDVEVCNQPLVKDCSVEGKEVCSIETITECSTEFMEQTQEEDVPSCEMKTEARCPDPIVDDDEEPYPEDEEGKRNDPRCTLVQVQKCTTNTMNVRKVMEMPSCRPKTMKVCGPERCPVVKGKKRCHTEERTDIKHELDENCVITPNTVCSNVSIPIPYLKAEEECVDVPKEVCSMVRVNPSVTQHPVIQKWCGPRNLVPKDGEEVDEDGIPVDTTPVGNSDTPGTFLREAPLPQAPVEGRASTIVLKKTEEKLSKEEFQALIQKASIEAAAAEGLDLSEDQIKEKIDQATKSVRARSSKVARGDM